MITTKIVVYPFSCEALPLVKYLNEFEKSYEIISIVAPKGTGLVGKDAGVADNRDPIGIIVEADINNALNKVDTLLVAGGKYDDVLHNKTIEVILSAIEQDKNIICCMELCPKDLLHIQNVIEKSMGSFRYCVHENEKSLINLINQNPSKCLYNPTATVIFVGGLVDEANNFEILLATINKFNNDGYRVSAIGTKHYCELLSVHSMPSMILSKNVTEKDKIHHFNDLIRYIDKKESPDIIVVGIPGGMMKFNDILTNDFGIYAYLISQAVLPDYFICCNFCGEFTDEFYKNISNIFYYKFGFGIDCVHVSNKLLDIQESVTTYKMDYLNIESSEVKKEALLHRNNQILTYHMIDKDEMDLAYKDMLGVLDEYSEAPIIV